MPGPGHGERGGLPETYNYAKELWMERLMASEAVTDSPPRNVLKLEIAAGARQRGRLMIIGGQHAHKSTQAFPSRFGKGRIGPDDFPNHDPSRDVQCAFRWWTHGQRYRALRTETYAPGAGLLARAHAHGLSKHVNRY